MSLGDILGTTAELLHGLQSITDDFLTELKGRRALRSHYRTKRENFAGFPEEYLPQGSEIRAYSVYHDMERKSHYPNEYQDALVHTFSTQRLETHRQNRTSKPLFFYDQLMLPAVIRHVLNETAFYGLSRRMTRATLKGHCLYENDGGDLPVVLPSDDAADFVQGMLVFGFSAQEQNMIQEFKIGGTDKGLYRLEVGKIEFLDTDGALHTEDVGFYLWVGGNEGLIRANEKAWDPEKFLHTSIYRDMPQPQS